MKRGLTEVTFIIASQLAVIYLISTAMKFEGTFLGTLLMILGVAFLILCITCFIFLEEDFR